MRLLRFLLWPQEPDGPIPVIRFLGVDVHRPVFVAVVMVVLGALVLSFLFDLRLR